MKTYQVVFSAVLFLANITRGVDFTQNVAEIVAPSASGTNNKANGLLFRDDDATYLLTVGHEFREAEDERPLKILAFNGKQARGQILSNFYDELDPTTTDVAVVKVSAATPLPSTYHWQRGKLIGDVAKPGAAVHIHNGLETILGYYIDGEPTAASIFIKSDADAKILQGYSGSVVTIGEVVIGLLRAGDPMTKRIELIRMDVAAAQVSRSLISLPLGDSAVLASWSERDLRIGRHGPAQVWLDRARGLATTATIDRQAIESQLTLAQAACDIAQGKIYEAEQALLQLMTTVDSRNEWRYGAQCRILLGKIGRIVGYKFPGKYAEHMQNPTPVIEESLLLPIKEAQKYFDEAVALLRQRNEPALLGAALLGQAAGYEYEAQQRSYREVLDLCREPSPNEAVIAGGHLNLIRAQLGFPTEAEVSSLFAALSDHEKAWVYLSVGEQVENAIPLLEASGTPFEIAYAQELAGDASSDPDVALPYYRSALDYYTANHFGTLSLYRVMAKAQRFYPRGLSEGGVNYGR